MLTERSQIGNARYFDFIVRILWKRQNTGADNSLVVARGMEEGRNCYKGSEGTFGWHATLLYLDCDDGYTSVCVETQKCTVKRVNFTVYKLCSKSDLTKKIETFSD